MTATILKGPWPPRPTPEEARLAMEIVQAWRLRTATEITEAALVESADRHGFDRDVISIVVWPMIELAIAQEAVRRPNTRSENV